MISTILDTACWLTGFMAIGAYVMALLRNRPYLRPMNALGLLLLGGALLGVPRLYPHPVTPQLLPYVIYLSVLLIASAVLQTISALRRRRRREDTAPDAATTPASTKSSAFQ